MESKSTGQIPDEQHLMGVFARIPVEFVAGQGMELYDASGKRYYDFLSGFAVVSL
ncbi:MAG: hypothetical protein FWD41_03445 [Actinomycetia bacterium]|nr:hypothetical protein [Actinomycetes bacterium]